MKSDKLKRDEAGTASRLAKNLLYCLLLVAALLGIFLSYMVSIYDYDWTPDIPDRLDKDAVAASLMVGILGVMAAGGGIVLKWRSLALRTLGVVLVVIGGIRIIQLTLL